MYTALKQSKYYLRQTLFVLIVGREFFGCKIGPGNVKLWQQVRSDSLLRNLLWKFRRRFKNFGGASERFPRNVMNNPYDLYNKSYQLTVLLQII